MNLKQPFKYNLDSPGRWTEIYKQNNNNKTQSQTESFQMFNLQQELLRVIHLPYSHKNVNKHNLCDRHGICINEYKNVQRYKWFTCWEKMYQSQAMNTLKDVNVDFFISKNPHAWSTYIYT